MRRVRDLALLGVGLAAIAWLISTFGLGGLRGALSHVAVEPLLFYGGLAVATFAGLSVRWLMIARALGADPPLRTLFAARLSGDAMGVIVPSAKLAGEPIRVALVYARCGDGPRSAAAVTVDRIVETIGNLFCLVLYVSIFVLGRASGDSLGGAPVLVGAALAVLVGMLVLVAVMRGGRGPLAPLYGEGIRRRLPRWQGWFDGLKEADSHLVHFFRDHRGTFVAALLLSLLVEGMVILEYRALLGAFGIELELPVLLMAMVTTGLARAAPTPGGLGALEAGQAALLEITSGRGDLGLAVGIIIRLHESLWGAIGLVVLTLHGITLGKARRLAAPPAGASLDSVSR